jgi:hypothetical protein
MSEEEYYVTWAKLEEWVQMPLTNIFLLKNTFLLASELKRGKRIWV